MGAGRNAKRMVSCFNPPYTQKEQQNELNGSNYRGISLLNVTYKVMAKIIAKRLTP
jgi:hypothetical protein